MSQVNSQDVIRKTLKRGSLPVPDVNVPSDSSNVETSIYKSKSARLAMKELYAERIMEMIYANCLLGLLFKKLEFIISNSLKIDPSDPNIHSLKSTLESMKSPSNNDVESLINLVEKSIPILKKLCPLSNELEKPEKDAVPLNTEEFNQGIKPSWLTRKTDLSHTGMDVTMESFNELEEAAQTQVEQEPQLLQEQQNENNNTNSNTGNVVVTHQKLAKRFGNCSMARNKKKYSRAGYGRR